RKASGSATSAGYGSGPAPRSTTRVHRPGSRPSGTQNADAAPGLPHRHTVRGRARGRMPAGGQWGMLPRDLTHGLLSRPARVKGDEPDQEEREAEDEEDDGRLEHRGDGLMAHHQILEAGHRPGGGERLRDVAHPARLEVEGPPAAADGAHGDDRDRTEGNDGVAGRRQAGD